MLFRLSCSVILIFLGIASPWLVKDWLELQKTQQVVSALPAPEARSSDRRSLASSSSAERRYSDASTSYKVVEGLIPSALSVATPPILPFFSGNRTGTSERAREISKKVAGKLRSDLDRKGLRLGDPVFIRIFKESKELELWLQSPETREYVRFSSYPVVSWSGKLGPKLREGDRQTPEGFYYVTASRLRPDTRHHLGIDLGYPNSYDTYHRRTGGDLLIHGDGPSNGSIVLSDKDIEQVYTVVDAALANGQKYFRVNVFPFRMTDRRMDSEWALQPRWIDFWANLKEGYDFFENTKIPPNAEVQSGKYHFAFH